MVSPYDSALQAGYRSVRNMPQHVRTLCPLPGPGMQHWIFPCATFRLWNHRPFGSSRQTENLISNIIRVSCRADPLFWIAFIRTAAESCMIFTALLPAEEKTPCFSGSAIYVMKISWNMIKCLRTGCVYGGNHATENNELLLSGCMKADGYLRRK